MTEENQQSAQSAQKKLAPADMRIDSFDPKVEGVKPLTQEGTPVPKSKDKQVRDAAERAGLKLREVS